MKTNNKYEALKNRLLEKMREKNLSIAALERKAGLKVHAIRNFTLGRSKKPNIENLQAVVKVLECSIEELFNNQKEEIKSENIFLLYTEEEKTILVENMSLFKNIVELISKIYSSKNYVPSVEQVLFPIKEIYIFCAKNQYNVPDENFAEWMITKCITTKKMI